ncbi:hypothetical protein [Mycoplasmoides alvi]|uniref:hypothetical protein n=1 Tax=Mycoplasmoides alvi TaxID=78580 RepID=UPI00051B1036|nr:hypothetical protein [Mycoplasmoides alvi]
MSNYNKVEILKITTVWMFFIGLLSFIITSILAIGHAPYSAILALFIVGWIFLIPSSVIWISFWFKKINKKIINK